MSQKDAIKRAMKNIRYWSEYLTGIEKVGSMRNVCLELPMVRVNVHILRFLKWDVSLDVLSIDGRVKKLKPASAVSGESPCTLRFNPKTGKGKIPYAFLAKAKLKELTPEDAALMAVDSYRGPALTAILKGKPPRWWK